jgi:hypothetical protein
VTFLAVSNVLQDAMVIANNKMRRLLLFYCVVFILFLPRAAYEGLLAYASSSSLSDCGDLCDPCQPIASNILTWEFSHQEIAAIISALSSALLSVVSVWFMLTADEKRVLTSGTLKDQDQSASRLLLESKLHQELNLDGSLL